MESKYMNINTGMANTREEWELSYSSEEAFDQDRGQTLIEVIDYKGHLYRLPNYSLFLQGKPKTNSQRR